MKARPLLRWAGILCVIAAVSVVCIEARGAATPKPAGTERPDLIRIDALAAYGKLELPPVAFAHDKHTDALKKAGKDCKACHKEDGGKLVLQFMRVKDAGFEGTKLIYHDNCIGCHKETAAKGQKAGPTDSQCRQCHDAKAKPGTQLPVGFDNVLHTRHLASRDIAPVAPASSAPAAVAANQASDKDNCGACHHEYDKAAKKTVWVKGQEGSCRFCHEQKPVKSADLGVEVKSFRTAGHLDCVRCHLGLEAQKKDAGPVQCKGCHSADGQAAITASDAKALAKMGGVVPRLKRGQPDAAVIAPKVDKTRLPEGGKVYAMRPVPFDHKAHELANDTCRVCHHKAMDSCAARCHTLEGSKDGNFVNLETSMHLMGAKQSCLGCHQQKQADAKCAGCHNSADKTRKRDLATCRKCHAEPGAGQTALDPVALSGMKPEDEKPLADPYLGARKLEAQVYPTDDIPEKVVIKGLVDEYEASEMPHRKIVLSLLKGMKDDKLAGYFHSDEGTVCRGCHHNSPASKTPPHCASCHGKPFSPNEPNRPGLKAAYHDQCMGCHKAMKLEKPLATDCNAGCHKPRKKS